MTNRDASRRRPVSLLRHEPLEVRALLAVTLAGTSDSLWPQTLDEPSAVTVTAAATAPLPTAGLLLRYETTGTTPYTSASGVVSSWNDQAGTTAENATNATAASRPTLIAQGTPSGLPSLSFSGSQSLNLGAASVLNGAQTLTWFVVFKQGNTQPGALLRTQTAARTNYWGTYNDAGSLVSNSRTSANGFVGASTAFTERNNWHISSSVWNGTAAAVNGNAAATIAAWMDGNSLGSAAGANGSPGNHISTTIGMNPDNTLGFTGEIAAVLVYNTCLSAADRQAVEVYLRDTYFQVTDNAALAPFLNAGTLASQTLWDTSGGRTIITAKDGSVLAIRDDKVRRSTDGGVTWAAQELISSALGKEGKCVVDEVNGNILYICPMDGIRFRSSNHGISWVREAITVRANSRGDTPDGIQANQPGITIMTGPNAGRLLIPARVMPGGNAVSARPNHYNTSIYSDDRGLTWQTSEPFPDFGHGEAALAELSNGNVLFSSREHMTRDFRHFAWSYDSGATYQDAFVSPVLPDGPRGSSYGLMGGLVRMPVPGADILLYSNIDTDAGVMPSEPGGSTTVGRERITVWASFDGGQTWPVKRLVYDGPSGYSNLAVGRAGTPSAGKIYLDYEGGPGGQDSSVRVATFDLKWLLNGWNVDTFFNPTNADVTTSATWEGLTGSSSWAAGNNWVGSTPTFDNTLDVTFYTPGAGNLTNAIVSDRNVRSLCFTADADAAVNIYLADSTANATGRRLRMGSGTGGTVTNTIAAGATGAIQVGFNDVGVVELTNPMVINHAGSGAFGFQAPIDGAAGNSLTVNSTGTGSVFLSSSNTFSGGVVLNAGLLRVGDDKGLGTGNFTFNGGTLANATSTMRTVTNRVNVRGSVTLGNFRSAPTLAGTVDLGNATRTVTVNVSSTIAGPVINGGLTKAGAATLVLAGANTYTGTTTVTAGTLAVGDGTSGSIAPGSAVTIAAGATLSHNRDTNAALANSISGTGTIANDGTGELALSGTNSFSGTIIPAGNKIAITSTTADDGVPNVVATSTFSIGEAFVGGTATINALTGGGFVDPIYGATAGTRTISVRSGDFTGVMRDGTNGRVLAVTKTAAGTLRLAGANTYTGTTTVSAGTLQVDGNQSAATGAVSVASGGTLSGVGTVGGMTTILSGATLSPGFAVSGFSFAAGLTLAAGSNYNWQVTNAGGTAGTGWDTVNVGGPVAITATSASPVKINVWSLLGTNPDINGNAAGFDPTRNQAWRIARATGGISGFAANKFQIVTSAANGTGGFANALSGGTFSVAQSGNDLNLVFTAAAVATPAIGSTGTLAALSTLLGTASSVTTVSVTGSNLIAAIVATAPAGFEVSSNGTTFGETAQFTPTAGVVSGTLSVRLAAATALGAYAGSVVLSSTGATSVNVAISSSTVTDTLTFNVASGTTVTDEAVRSGAIKFVKRGAGTLVLNLANAHTGTTTVESGTLVVAAGNALASSAVTVQPGARLEVAPGVAATMGGLMVNAGGLVDVGSGMITVAAGLSPADLVTALASGRGDGSWNGTSGITSAAAAADLAAGITRTVGWLDNGDGSVAFAYSTPGDTNLDWTVDVLDAANLLTGGKFNSGAPASWSDGDFGYDGVVDVLDAADFLTTQMFNAGTYNATGGAAGRGDQASGKTLSSAMESWTILAAAAASPDQGSTSRRKTARAAGIAMP